MQDSVQLVLELLKAEVQPGYFKEFYDGDPDLIPDFNLPCIVVSKSGDNEEPATSVDDDVVDSVVIKVILNKKDDWSGDVDPLNMTERKIRDIISARDATTGKYLPTTVKGAIRKDLDGDSRIGQSMSLELGISPRPNDVITAEGHLTVQIKYSVDVS